MRPHSSNELPGCTVAVQVCGSRTGRRVGGPSLQVTQQSAQTATTAVSAMPNTKLYYWENISRCINLAETQRRTTGETLL